ncbi:family 16 glycoside hydrolase [Emticicia sp. 17c]|uniref:family 16 glycoside hydrolase n=1 Tax=Emticicia sp. 17c TaxID=3127704 RepID=UPI00301C8F97
MRKITSFILCLLVGVSFNLLAQVNLKDWQALSENNEPATVTEQTYKDKTCIKLDGKKEAVLINKARTYDNFRIDFDIAARVMAGVGFHTKNEQNYQFLYFRPGYGGTQEAIQYIPIYNGGLSWVMYHYPIYEAKTDIASMEWFHATIEVRNKILKVYVNYKKEPDMTLTLLDTDTEKGNILLRSMFGEAYFANVQIQEIPKAMTDWAVSEQLPRDKSYEYADMKKVKNWTKINQKNDEMVNLKRYFEYPDGTVFAKRTIVADTDKSHLLYFDFTGKLQVYLNGKQIFNYTKYKLDRLDPQTNCTVLDLKRGENELVFVVEGDAFFFGKGFNSMGRFQHQNWGFIASLAEKMR